MSLLAEFADSLDRPDLLAFLRAGLIGDNAVIDGPCGPKTLIYADYVASGRALAQIEDWVRENVLPFYGNTHTEASYVGAFCTRLREEARARIAAMTNAGDDCSVVFTGAGATSGLNRIAGLLDIAGVVADGRRAVVLVGPYEHHSNLLPWRESGADVVEIPEGPRGGPDIDRLEAALAAARDADLIVGAFGAASNVTGIITDTDDITRRLKAHDAYAVWDYGCAAPYMPISMGDQPDALKDAIVFSPHKFPGGPGASGIMIVRDAMAGRATPTLPGGGTVSFVSPWDHIYSTKLVNREEGGTPNVIGDIRAALAMIVKESLGAEWLAARQDALRKRALAVWRRNPSIEVLGLPEPENGALPIFSFRVRAGANGYVHHQLFTRLLSDVHGIQARGGCACAGSYGHHLLGITEPESKALVSALAAGLETEKPGWIRLNLSALLTDEKADIIIEAVDTLAHGAVDYINTYQADEATARFTPASQADVSVLEGTK